ncbi:unnamed protein product [Cylicocyclus nassatus]|uniref:MMS19 nucleotide excision repair protein n=1 Tax=Cylicocyclus nassatus TaxID=53992 RepID=A0AA36GHL6_CYLNA|nr:unnamed protein product [Cylicocyclus nassatus]
MVLASGDAGLYQRMVADRSLPLSDYLEMKKPQLLSQNEDVRDATLSEIVDTVCALPNAFLSKDQVALLLDFFLGRLESSPTAASHAIRGVHHLVLHSQNLPDDFERPLVQIMFKDGNVQGWDVDNRLLQYNILEWLLLHRLKELKSLGSDFAMTFIKTMGGERHPKCLPLVFRMFVIVAQLCTLGPFVEDLFEVVACYFPVEFKQTASSPITKDLLAEGCLKCLVAHPDFAPYCYLLIEEKFTDDETTPEQREDTCVLLAEAAKVFPAEELVDHLEVLLGGLRVVGLDLKGSLPESVTRALTEITKAVEKIDAEATKKLGSQLIENLEPFVLQAEMGLTERALSLLRCAAEAGPSIRNQIYDQVIPWILMLAQGDVVNVKADRLEILQEGLKALMDWAKCIHENGFDTVLSRFQSSLFASLDAARETAPNEALTALHTCASVYLKIVPLSEETLSRSIELVRASWGRLLQDSAKASYLNLITTLAQTKWESLQSIIAEKPEISVGDFPMLCAAVHDKSSYEELLKRLLSALSQNASPEMFASVLDMAKRLTVKAPNMVPHLVEQFIALASKIKDPSREVVTSYGETLQAMGLLLDKDTRHRFAEKVVDMGQLMDMFCLIVIQSQNVDLMERCLKNLATNEHCLYLLFTGIANHIDDLQRLQTVKNSIPKFDVDCAIAKGLLLRGKKEGVKLVNELFDRLCHVKDSQQVRLCLQLNDLFDFDSPANDPQRSLHKTTFLWKQRVFNQLSNCYVTAVNSADQGGKDVLMRLLPALLKSTENNPAVQQQFDEFLPVFRVALDAKDIQPSVLSSLPRFIGGLPSSAISIDDGKRIIAATTRTLNNGHPPMVTVLSCLEALGLLAKRASYDFRDADITTVVGAATQALAHPKRIVRQKAAAIRNLWETKRQ